jgi:hypothetical protein
MKRDDWPGIRDEWRIKLHRRSSNSGMRYAIVLLTTFTFCMPTGLRAVPRQADPILVGVANPAGVTSSTPDVIPVATTGTFDDGVVVDPFRARLVTICTSRAKGASLDPLSLAGPIVRCEMPDNTPEQWAFNSKAGSDDGFVVATRAEPPATVPSDRPVK